MRQKTVITKLLQSVTEVYYKVRQVLQSVTLLLQSATVITKRDVTPETYLGACQVFKMRAFLKNGQRFSQWFLAVNYFNKDVDRALNTHLN